MPQSAKHLGIYIHVPFCARKCAYCDFYSVTDASLMREYTSAVVAHIRSKKKEFKNAVADTVFFGGGTPSLLPVEYIYEILEAVRSVFKVADDAEITLEANPGTLDSPKLAAYRQMGINRLSLGLQSADENELATLHRIHTRNEFEHSFMLARLEGFDNINVDLIYALPNQTKAKLFDNLSYVISLNPEHISLYGLTIEEDTPFGQNPEIIKAIPDEDMQFDMYKSSCMELDKHGYKQYEISNFAKKGYACTHNIKYWTNLEYIGFGPAAASFVDNTEYCYARDLPLYISCVNDESGIRVYDEDVGAPEHVLDKEELETRYLMTSFRLRAGINCAEYNRLFGQPFEKKYEDKIEKYINAEFMVKTLHGYRLTRRGMMISNTILSDILTFKSHNGG